MKGFDSLRSARKSLIIQVSVLVAVVILIVAGGRLQARNRFNTAMILSFDRTEWKAEDLRVEWDRPEAPRVSYTIGYEEDRDGDNVVHATVLYLNLSPQQPGDFTLNVFDPDGKALSMDVVHVRKTGFAMSAGSGCFTGDEAVFLAALLLYVGLAVIMLVFSLRLRGPLMYSYEAILAIGVLAFSLFTIILEVPFYLKHLRNPALYTIWELLSDLGGGGKYFMVLTSPLVAVFSILLMVSNIELLRHERPRFQNFLGLLLGLLLMGGEAAFILHYMGFYSGSFEEIRLITTLENICGIVFSYVECILLSSVICGIRAARHVPKPDRDYILILGCRFRKDGSLPPLLRGRVDKAMEFWRRQKAATGKEAVVIPSGGQGRDETMAEAEAMRRYMLGTGFPEHAVIVEDRSANTYQNMEFSKKIIEARTGSASEARIAYVTTNYHVFRSGVWAGLAGLPAEGLGSRTKWWFWPNAFVRECVGLLYNRIIPEIVLLLLLVAGFGAFTYITMSVF